jgi:hypothetical protein
VQDALWCLGDDGGQDPASVYRGEVVAGEPAGLEGFGQQAWRWRRQARDTGHNQINTVGLSRLIPCLETDHICDTRGLTYNQLISQNAMSRKSVAEIPVSPAAFQ